MVHIHSIRNKIWACVGVAFIGLLIATVSTLLTNTTHTANLTMLEGHDIPQALKRGEALNLFRKQTKLFEDAFMLAEKDSLASGNELSKEILALLELMKTNSVKMGTNHQEIDGLMQDFAKYAQMASQHYGQSTANTDPGFLENIQKTGQLQTKLLEQLENSYKSAIVKVENKINEEKTLAKRSTYFHFTLFILVLVLSVFIINLIANRLLIKPLNNIEEMVAALSAGKLAMKQRIKAHPNDEIGQLAANIHDMAGNLSSMVTRVNTTSDELISVSENLRNTSLQVTDAAHMQSAGVKDTSKSVSQIISSIDEVGSGVEVLTVSARDSAASIHEMAVTFEEVATSAENLFQSVDEVNSAIYEMAASLKEVAASATSLKKTSDVTSSSVAQMDDSIKLIDINARETASITESVRSDAEIGKGAVDATISGIDNIKQSSAIVSGAIQSLTEKASNIGNILTVINEITSQTALLALNAAIISAQAGIHGKGFSVVASEIRDLAERTAGSTKEIEEVIFGVQAETRKAFDAMQMADKSIQDGELLSKKSGVALENIVIGVQKAAKQMDLISSATLKQGEDSKVIRSAMEKVSEMVGQIAAATAEQQAGSELILAAAENMRTLTRSVQTATREQSLAGKVISDSTENINAIIFRIKQACDDQSTESREIVASIEEFTEITQVNLTSTNVLNEAVDRLRMQTRVLKKEMGSFVLTDASPARPSA